jgi:proteic killer suppression protein
VIRSFRHKGLEKFFLTGGKGGITIAHEKRLRLILGRLDAAHEPQDMDLPGLRLHKLTGKLKGYWTVEVSGNWRVIFEFYQHAAWNVDYVDYH